MGYKNELVKSMEWLAGKPDTIFLGQSVNYSGNAIYNTLQTVPEEKKIETPVFEELQMGLSMGMALEGYVPITCYPRFDFLILACNQLVNHLDRLKDYSHGEYVPKVIIRVGIGSERPLNPQPQHVGDFTQAFRGMLQNIEVIRCDEPEHIFPAYQKAYNRTDGKSTIVVEYGDYYGEK